MTGLIVEESEGPVLEQLASEVIPPLRVLVD